MGWRAAQEVRSRTRLQGCGSASVVQANHPADHLDVEVVHAFKVLAEEACCFDSDRRRCVHEYSLVTERVLRQNCLRKALACAEDRGASGRSACYCILPYRK